MNKGLSYIKGKSDVPLREITMGNLIGESIEKFKDKVLISSREQKKNLTASEFLEEIDSFAAGLYEIGLKRGEKIGIIVNNSIEACIAIFSCFRGGFVAVLINPVLQPNELKYFLKTLEISCIISVDKCKNYNVLEILERIVPEIKDSCSNLIESKQFPALKQVIIFSEIKYSGTTSYGTIRCLGKNISKQTLRNNQKQISCHDLSFITFTSGSTGIPKIVGMSHYQMTNGSYLLGLRIIHFQINQKYCSNSPLFHLFGLTFVTICFINGVTVFLPSLYYSPEKCLRTISEENCTYIMGTPTILADLVKVQKKLNFPLSPYMAICGGAPGSPNLFKVILEVLNVRHLKFGYGMSEALAITWPNLTALNDFDTVGQIMDHLEAKVVNSEGNVVPIGIVGELKVRGYSIIDQYLFNNTEVLDKDRWFTTGDAAAFDVDGKLRISGRLKDIINRGGENISPREIEQILETHPNILEVSVVGSYHERLGEEVCACIKLKPDSSLNLDEIRRFCQGKLSYFKIPSKFEICIDFPRTALGKVQKSKLLEEINKNYNREVYTDCDSRI